MSALLPPETPKIVILSPGCWPLGCQFYPKTPITPITAESTMSQVLNKFLVSFSSYRQDLWYLTPSEVCPTAEIGGKSKYYLLDSLSRIWYHAP